MGVAAPQVQAGGTIEPSRFVKPGASNNTVIQATANSKILGISQSGSKAAPQSGSATAAAASGDPLRIYTVGDVCRVTAGASITKGDDLESDANGKAVPAAATAASVRRIGAIALEDGSANELVQVQIVIFALTNPA